MSERINNLRGSRKNPSVLRLKLISVRSALANQAIFIFEGQDDVGVYEEWISRCGNKLSYEAIAGNGKEQLIGLRDQLQVANSPLLRNVYFFVDCDFDEHGGCQDNLFTLDAYSIENVLCGREAVESLLKDEFRCSGSPRERQVILDKFDSIRREFGSVAQELNFYLYVARRQSINVVKKPETIGSIVSVGLSGISWKIEDSSVLVLLECKPDEDELKNTREEFMALSELRAQRGKYMFLLLRKWLAELTEDAKMENPTIFEEKKNVSGDPSGVTLRRLASASKLPVGLDEFLNKLRVDRLYESSSEKQEIERYA